MAGGEPKSGRVWSVRKTSRGVSVQRARGIKAGPSGGVTSNRVPESWVRTPQVRSLARGQGSPEGMAAAGG